MSHWQTLDIGRKLEEILREAEYYDPDHHFGRPFLSAYQLAIEFARRHPEDFAAIGLPIGGADVGQQSSLAQYLAGQLSRAIRDGRMTSVEGGFISNIHLKDIVFKGTDRDFHSSLTQTQYDLSIFRWREPAQSK